MLGKLPASNVVLLFVLASNLATAHTSNNLFCNDIPVLTFTFESEGALFTFRFSGPVFSPLFALLPTSVSACVCLLFIAAYLDTPVLIYTSESEGALFTLRFSGPRYSPLFASPPTSASVSTVADV